MLFNRAGHLAVAGKVAGTAGARLANLNRDAFSTAFYMDSRPRGHCPSRDIPSCFHFIRIIYIDKYPSRNWDVRCTTHHEYPRGGQ